MQLAPIATTAAARPIDEGNPWRLPTIDTELAQRAIDGIEKTQAAINRLIDRSIDVRVMLDRDIKARTLSDDTVRGVELLVRARDYANERINDDFLPGSLTSELWSWSRESGDQRVAGIPQQVEELRDAAYDLLDDDEGNNAERIEYMRSNPSIGLWKSVREILDWGIGDMYARRDATDAIHVLRAGGGLYGA